MSRYVICSSEKEKWSPRYCSLLRCTCYKYTCLFNAVKFCYVIYNMFVFCFRMEMIKKARSAVIIKWLWRCANSAGVPNVHVHKRLSSKLCEWKLDYAIQTILSIKFCKENIYCYTFWSKIFYDFINLTQVQNFTVNAQDIFTSVDFRYLP